MNDTKKVLVGVTGCIAAYKSCEIVRGLQKAGFDTQVVMTASAQKFVGKATFDALCQHPTSTELFEDVLPIPHITLAQSCDLFLIAPCTANVIAKIAHGIADDLLTSVALACPSPVMIAPAMNVNMYENPATQENLALLRARGIKLIEPEVGHLACGDEGKGKLARVEVIVDACVQALSSQQKPLEGKRVLITAGPTQEPIDEVRYISNHSSGKMGCELARAACEAGAEVCVISGPVDLVYPEGTDVIRVKRAEEMDEQALAHGRDADIIICAAAVADYAPKKRFEGKLKKDRNDDALAHIDFERTPDILANLSAERRPGQVIIGFAAETDKVIDEARRKVIAKGVDAIVANDVSGGKVFGKDETEIAIVTATDAVELPSQSKRHAAQAVIDTAKDLLKCS